MSRDNIFWNMGSVWPEKVHNRDVKYRAPNIDVYETLNAKKKLLAANKSELWTKLFSHFQDTRWIVRRDLVLSGANGGSTMTVSVLFYPVRSVQQVISSRRSSIAPMINEDEPKGKRNSLPWMQQAVCHIWIKKKLQQRKNSTKLRKIEFSRLIFVSHHFFSFLL